MKSMLIKTCILLPFVALGGYYFLALFGCVACAVGAKDAFFCGFYCKFGVAFMLALGGLFLSYQVLKYYRNCQSTSTDQ